MKLIRSALFFRKRNYISSSSLSGLAWEKFKKNRLGFGSLIFIGLTALITVMGYLITPDSTPYANDQCLELGTKKPGYKVMMLLVRKKQESVRSNFLQTMISGKRSNFTAIPINGYRIEGENISGGSE